MLPLSTCGHKSIKDHNFRLIVVFLDRSQYPATLIPDGFNYQTGKTLSSPEEVEEADV